jgi:hypothetical protein
MCDVCVFFLKWSQCSTQRAMGPWRKGSTTATATDNNTCILPHTWLFSCCSNCPGPQISRTPSWNRNLRLLGLARLEWMDWICQRQHTNGNSVSISAAQKCNPFCLLRLFTDVCRSRKKPCSDWKSQAWCFPCTVSYRYDTGHFLTDVNVSVTAIHQDMYNIIVQKKKDMYNISPRQWGRIDRHRL